METMHDALIIYTKHYKNACTTLDLGTYNITCKHKTLLNRPTHNKREQNYVVMNIGPDALGWAHLTTEEIKKNL